MAELAPGAGRYRTAGLEEVVRSTPTSTARLLPCCGPAGKPGEATGLARVLSDDTFITVPFGRLRQGLAEKRPRSSRDC
jgi:hypothetical protein